MGKDNIAAVSAKDPVGGKAKVMTIRILLLIFFVILFCLIMLPFYAITLASFKPGADIIKYGLNLDFDLSTMSLKNFFLCSDGYLKRYE